MKKRYIFLLILIFLSSGCNLNVETLTPTHPESTPSATQPPTITALPIAGDLGWGKIHGKITDAITGAPIVGAIISCEHHSYASLATCSGTATTDESGKYVFENVFFHDTDTIKLTIEAVGYQTQEITNAPFTMADLEANVSLIHMP